MKAIHEHLLWKDKDKDQEHPWQDIPVPIESDIILFWVKQLRNCFSPTMHLSPDLYNYLPHWRSPSTGVAINMLAQAWTKERAVEKAVQRTAVSLSLHYNKIISNAILATR